MVRPLAAKRSSEIRRLLRVDGAVRVIDLAELFNVSQETIRRDLKQLGEAKHAVVVHGGATQVGSAELKLDIREHSAESQARIAKAASALVPNGATIMLDAGATMHMVATALVPLKSITVTTNSLTVASILARAGKRVHILPGEVAIRDEAVMSGATIEALTNQRFDIAFVAASKLAAPSGLTDTTRLAAQFRSKILQSANKAYLVINPGTVDRQATFPIHNVERITAVITGTQPKAPLRRWLMKRNIKLIVA
jgi:DeoR family transcriptional regulator, glycerol-3-phosphate regulon repressor